MKHGLKTQESYIFKSKKMYINLSLSRQEVQAVLQGFKRFLWVERWTRDWIAIGGYHRGKNLKILSLLCRTLPDSLCLSLTHTQMDMWFVLYKTSRVWYITWKCEGVLHNKINLKFLLLKVSLTLPPGISFIPVCYVTLTCFFTTSCSLGFSQEPKFLFFINQNKWIPVCIFKLSSKPCWSCFCWYVSCQRLVHNCSVIE